PATQAVLRKTAAPVPSAPNRRRYYGTGDEGPSYAAARKDYELRIWDVLSRLRNQINKSRRLASENAYKTLVSLYDRIVEIDAQLTEAARQSPSPKQSEELSRLNTVIRWEMTEKLSQNSVGTDTYTISASIDSASPITGIFLDAIKNPTLQRARRTVFQRKLRRIGVHFGRQRRQLHAVHD